MPDNVILSISLPRELRDQVVDHADGRTTAAIIRQALKLWLQRAEVDQSGKLRRKA